MAIVHNKAGKHAKSHAIRRSRQILHLLIGVSGVTGGIAVFVAMRLGTITAMVVAIAFACLAYFLGRRLERYIDQLARDRIKWMRGAQTEGFVAWLLQDLDDSWHVFNNLQLEEASDIDHVVIGHGGVFCVSTKSFRGLFDIDAKGNLTHNGAETCLLQDTFHQAMRVRDRMKALVGEGAPFIVPVLAVPFGYVNFSGMKRNVWVLHQEDLTKVLEGAPKQLNPRDVARYVRALEMLQQSAALVYQRPAAVTSEP